jgi:hypothetical protein
MVYNIPYPTLATDNLVAGPQTTEGTGTEMFFINNTANDTSTGSFRAGTVSSTQWTKGNRGANSMASGTDNIAAGAESACLGGTRNSITGLGISLIGGGTDNLILTGLNNFVCGTDNSTTSYDILMAGTGGVISGAQIGNAMLGGPSNTMDATSSVVSGTVNSLFGSTASAILTGTTNSITVSALNDMVICGGASNILANDGSFIGAGTNNTCNGVATALTNSAICGGFAGTCTGVHSAICGGSNGTCSGNNSCLIGGQSCSVTGNNSFVHGNSTTCTGNNSFSLQKGACQGNNSFLCDYSGAATLSGNNQFYFIASDNTSFYSNATITTGVNLAAGANAWAAVSDRRVKENIVEVDYDDVANRLKKLPIFEYNYIGQTENCIGPVAQDWHSIFRSSKNPLVIETMDLDGVALATIKSLASRLNNLKNRKKYG